MIGTVCAKTKYTIHTVMYSFKELSFFVFQF